MKGMKRMDSPGYIFLHLAFLGKNLSKKERLVCIECTLELSINSPSSEVRARQNG